MTAHLPPGPPPIRNPLDFLRAVMALRRDPLAALMQMHADYGDTVTYRIGSQIQIFTRDAQFSHEILVKQAAHFQKDHNYTDDQKGMALFLGSGLLTSNGDFWKRQRKLVAPALHTRRIEAYAQAMVAYSQDQLKGWRDGATLDISAEMNRITMRIVARTLFNADIEAEVNRVAWAMTVFQDLMTSATYALLPSWLPTPLALRGRKARRELDMLVYGMIAQRRASGEDKGDLLSMLLLAETEDGARMTDQQARDEVVTLFLAGHETTANALNWTWMLLAQHPAVEARLHAELDSVLGGRAPELTDLKRLPYTEMVVREALRLYPPAWVYSRAAAQDMTIGDFHIPQGAVVSVHTYALHRNPALWDDPDVFRPERFSPENEDALPRFGYLPFASGPRVCIGQAFAMMEAQLVLATVAQQYRLALAPGQQVRVAPLITLNPLGGLPMTVQRRQPVKPPQPEMADVTA